jgi:glycolate oxidase FAD binding subunit
MSAPETVERPTDAASCAAMLAHAAREGRSVRVRGADTKAYLGDLRRTDAVLETGAMTGIVDHVPADLTVTVAAGTRLADLQRALGAHGQFLPLDPPHADAATLGGVVASDSNGFGRLRYGGVRDLLIGTVVALADGTVAHGGGRVVKNVAGYDLNKLLIGSFGTLGVIAETTLKVLPLPGARALAVARCAGAPAAFAVADAIVRTALRPSALVVEGTRAAWTALVGAEGPAAQVDRAMREAARAAEAAGTTAERSDDDRPLAELRELPATATDGVLVRAALPLGAQRSFAESAAGLDAFARLVADAGSGVVRVHLRGDDATVLRDADTLLAAAAVVGGSARIERRDGSLRERLGAWGAVRPAGDFLMRRIKDAFDPRGVLEPGRAPIG